MSRLSQLERVLKCGVVAIIRAPSGEILADAAAALADGGVEAVEVTFTIPQAPKILEDVAARLGNRIVLGAGTALDAETARIAILAGAEFIVAPNLSLDVIRVAHRYDKLVFPGAFTPTEVVSAWEAGADIVKVFPSDFVGPGYLKALSGPLPQVRLMPTGGVNLQTAADFIRAGACALGIGGSLVEPKALSERNLTRIESLARQYVEIVRNARS